MQIPEVSVPFYRAAVSQPRLLRHAAWVEGMDTALSSCLLQK